MSASKLWIVWLFNAVGFFVASAMQMFIAVSYGKTAGIYRGLFKDDLAEMYGSIARNHLLIGFGFMILAMTSLVATLNYRAKSKQIQSDPA